eukprot:2910372-Prymnesium_polylepis.1
MKVTAFRIGWISEVWSQMLAAAWRAKNAPYSLLFFDAPPPALKLIAADLRTVPSQCPRLLGNQISGDYKTPFWSACNQRS